MKFACCMLAFTGGVLVGGIAALLLAPKKGDELRREIKEKLNEAKENIACASECCSSSSNNKVVKENVVVSVEE